MAKLWDKGYELDALIEEFTVGRDWELDLRLVPADCAGTLAHARMLERIGIFTAPELGSLKEELAAIVRDHAAGEFAIAPSDEDCHTAIENRLTARLGEIGKKVHTGRSRNDQVATALRIYARASLSECVSAALELANELTRFAREHERVPMPGRTHLQIAMPSSVGLWASAFAEELLDDARLAWCTYELGNQCPLGAAASYGVPLPLDRELVAELLGFPRVQTNVLYANNFRGKLESIILDALEQVALTLGKLAQDLMLFSLPELGYFSLPQELCSGSSIMPQKRNPDVLELVRAKAAVLGGYGAQVKGVIRSLPSGYNRDLQETKGPFVQGIDLALACVRVMSVAVSRLGVNKERLAAAFTPEIFATDAALELVRGGMSFRDAYREVGTHLERLTKRDPAASIATRTSTGTAGNLKLDSLAERIAAFAETVRGERERVGSALSRLFGEDVAIY